MRKSAEYAGRLRKLFHRLRRGGGKASLATVEDATETLLLGILSNYASEKKAAAALDKLLAETVDLNDLRVTPVADMVVCIGVDYPHCRIAAEEISRVLTAIFNRTHDLDLNFLATFSKKAASSFLDSLDGLSPHAKAFFMQQFLNAHAIPLDMNMHAYLIRNACLAEDTSVADAQRFLGNVIRERDRSSFYALLKRSAAAHAPRKAAEAGKRPAKPAAKKPTASKTPKKKAESTRSRVKKITKKTAKKGKSKTKAPRSKKRTARRR